MCGRLEPGSQMSSMSKKTAPGMCPRSVALARGRDHARQGERRVDDPDMRIVEMRGEPFGADESLRAGVGHRGLSP